MNKEMINHARDTGCISLSLGSPADMVSHKRLKPHRSRTGNARSNSSSAFVRRPGLFRFRTTWEAEAKWVATLYKLNRRLSQTLREASVVKATIVRELVR